MYSFNMNQECKVKLTEYGIFILRAKHKELNKVLHGRLGEYELKLDADGYYHEQFYELMNTFGRHLFIGGKEPFKDCIVTVCDG